MKEPTPRPLLFVFLFVGIAGVLLGLSGFGDAHDCAPAFSDKCLPGVLLEGNALFIAVGTAFFTVGTLRLINGRRPPATWLALLSGIIECAIGAWFAYALMTGLFLPANSFYSLYWPLGATIFTFGLGAGFLRAVRSDNGMMKILMSRPSAGDRH